MRRVILFTLCFLFIANLFSINKSKPIASIPFEMVGSYVVVTVKINESSPLNLILDSGIRNTIITELDPGDKLSLNFSDVKDLMGLGGGDHLEAYTSSYNTLKAGKLKLENKTVYVLHNDVFNLSKHTGTKINGLIGIDFFQGHTIEIDYSSRRIRFYNSDSFIAPKGYGMLPIFIELQKMFVELSVLKSDSTRKQARMLIDTGAELNAWFQTFTKESVQAPPKWVQGTIGEGLNGIITGKYGHIPQICFGEFCLKDPIVSFPDSTTIKGIITNSKRDGTIGSQILSRFNMFIDYENMKFYFKPNSNFTKRYSYNVAGIEVMQLTTAFTLIEVFEVWANSPAEKAGVKRDDQLLEVNGIKTFLMTIGDIRKIFETPSRRPLVLLLKRGDTEITVKIDMNDKI